jgi:1-acyl-sn-glycerol-3-phosphate acyltransferase
MLYRISTLLVYFCLKLFFGIEVAGKDEVPSSGPFILAANHLSNLDPPVLASVIPRKICFLAKEELFRNKIFALYLRDVGVIPLERQKTDIKAMRLALKVLKSRPLLVFPQGTRARSLDEALSGVGFLCKKARVPVVAAKIYGTDSALAPGAKFLSLSRIKVVFGRVTGIERDDDYGEITRRVVEKIKSL